MGRHLRHRRLPCVRCLLPVRQRYVSYIYLSLPASEFTSIRLNQLKLLSPDRFLPDAIPWTTLAS